MRLPGRALRCSPGTADGYPPLLREIYAPPPVLFVKGKLDSFTRHACGVVGTRRLTQYGKSATAAIVKRLVEKQIAIVSGLALGIDTVAVVTCEGPINTERTKALEKVWDNLKQHNRHKVILGHLAASTTSIRAASARSSRCTRKRRR